MRRSSESTTRRARTCPKCLAPSHWERLRCPWCSTFMAPLIMHCMRCCNLRLQSSVICTTTWTKFDALDCARSVSYCLHEKKSTQGKEVTERTGQAYKHGCV